METFRYGEGNPGCVKFQAFKEQGFYNVNPPFFAVKGSLPIGHLGLCVFQDNHVSFQELPKPALYPWGQDNVGVIMSPGQGAGKLYCVYKDYHAITHAGHIQSKVGKATDDDWDWRAFQCQRTPDPEIVYSQHLLRASSNPSRQAEVEKSCKHWLQEAAANRIESGMEYFQTQVNLKVSMVESSRVADSLKDVVKSCGQENYRIRTTLNDAIHTLSEPRAHASASVNTPSAQQPTPEPDQRAVSKDPSGNESPTAETGQ